jgi:SAM-dependent methyltransferase
METEEYDRMRALEDRHWWYRSLRSAALAQLDGAESILDAGCGTGGMLALLRDRQTVGIDNSEAALQHAEERGLTHLVQGSICSLPFASKSFHAVLALDVLYHKSVLDEDLAVRECARVLRPGGVAVLQVPAYRWLFGAHDRAVHGARRYTAKHLGKLVTSAGLEIVVLRYRNLLALPFAVVSRRLFPRTGGSDLRPLPEWLDAALYAVSCLENRWTNAFGLPAGLSVWCVARKPA